jgi:hypothetical protein
VDGRDKPGHDGHWPGEEHVPSCRSHDRVCDGAARCEPCAHGARTCTGGLPEPQHHLHRRLRAGRRHRHVCARRRPGAQRGGLFDRDREPRRRRLQHRRQGGRGCGARWLHAPLHRQQLRHQPDALSQPRLRDRGFAARRVRGDRQPGARRQRRHCGAQPAGLPAGAQNHAVQFRLRRIVGAHRRRIRVQGAGQG